MRAKVRKVVQGDANTQFFHLIANGKHRKKRIFQLEQDDGTILGQDNLKTYITEYYRQLFGPPEDNCVSLEDSRTEDVPQLSAAENEIQAVTGATISSRAVTNGVNACLLYFRSALQGGN